MASVFISYSRNDIEVARKLTEAFKGQDLDFWIDWEGIPPTVDWWKEIEKGIEEADIFLFLLSPDSCNSKVCKREIEHAAKHGKRLIPLVVRDIKAAASPPELGSLNWIFLRETDDFQTSFNRLLTAIKTDYVWVQAHRQLLVKALEWERSGHKNAFLLRGEELQEAETQLLANASKEPHPTDLQRDYVLKSQLATDRQRRQITSTAIAVAIVTAGLAIFGFVQARLANERAELALARQLAAQSVSQRDRDFPLSLLLGLEAFTTLETIETRGVLIDNAYAKSQVQTYLRGHNGSVNSLVFRPDAERPILASSSGWGGSILLWDLETRQPLGQPLAGYSESIAFSPNPAANTLVSGGDTGIMVWDVSTMLDLSAEAAQPTVQPWNGPVGTVRSIAFRPDLDGKKLVSGHADRSIIIWDLETGETLRHPLTANDDEALDIVGRGAFSPDGKLLALGSYDNITIWDVETREPIGPPLTGEASGYIADVTCLAFSPDAKILAACTSNAIILWDVQTGRPLSPPLLDEAGEVRGNPSDTKSVAFTLDGRMLAFGYEDGTISLWDVSILEDIHSTGANLLQRLDGKLSGVFSSVNSLCFIEGPDGKTLASGHADGTIVVWDVSNLSGNELETAGLIRQMNSGPTTFVNATDFSSDGKQLASGYGDGTVILWDLEKEPPMRHELGRQTGGVLSVAFSPDGNLLATGGEGIRLWDAKTGQPVGYPLEGHNDTVMSVAFSPDGRLLASSGSDGVLLLWDVEKQGPIGSPMGDASSSIFSVSFSPDGKTLASASANGISLWDVETKQALGEPWDAADSVLKVAFSPDGTILASGQADSTIILWEAATGEPLGPPLRRHTDLVNSLAFSPDGKTLASGSGDRTVILWDVETRAPLGQPLQWHSDSVNTVAFAPDGKTLASGSGSFDSGRIVLWDVDSESLIQKTCERVGRNLTYSEWAQYLPNNEEYRKTCQQFPKAVDYYQAIAEDILSGPYRRGQVQTALDQLSSEMKLDSSIDDPGDRSSKMVAGILGRKINQEVDGGNIRAALDWLADAKANDLSSGAWLEDALLLNTICWEGSLNGYALDAIEYCERAVSLEPDNADIRDSRGLARAITGDYAGAIEDFQFFLDHAEYDETFTPQRQQWVEELQAHRNPFTPEMLKQLKNRE